jgi:hypothetical protein
MTATMLILTMLPGTARAAWDDCGNEISTDSGDASARSAPGPEGSVIILFGLAGNLHAQKLDRDGQVMWGPAGKVVCDFPATARRDKRIVPDGVGGWLACWIDRRGADDNVYAQRMDAAGDRLWAPDGLLLCDDLNGQTDPDVASDGSGGAFVVWEDARPGNHKAIWGQRILPDGGLLGPLAGLPICVAPEAQQKPRIVPDGVGGAIAAWEDLRSLNGLDIYAQRLWPGGGNRWTWNGLPVTTAAGSQNAIEMLVDGAGGAFVGWVDLNGPHGLYLQRIDPTGTPQWASAGVRVGDGSVLQAAPDGAGGAVVSYVTDTSLDVYAQRVDGGGNVLWAAGGAPVCVHAASKVDLSMATDLRGGAVIAWRDHRSGQFDLFAQHVDSNGAALWAGNGQMVCEVGGGVAPSVVPDGSGSGIVTWHDLRNGTGVTNVYARRMLLPASAVGAPAIPGSAPDRLTIRSVRPLPMDARGTLDLDLPRSAHVEVQLFDVAGRRVRVLHSEPLPGGRNHVPLDLSGHGGAPVAGTYFLRVQAGEEAATGKVVIRR